MGKVKILGLFSALGVAATLVLSGVFTKAVVADDAKKKAPTAHEAQKIVAIPVNYVDTRGENLLEETIIDHAKLASGVSDGIVFVYYANGTASEDPDNTPIKKLDPKDGNIYNELNAAAQRLIHEGYPFNRIVLADSYSGNDDVDIFVDGTAMKPRHEGVKAGHGGLTVVITKETKDFWNMIQEIDHELASKESEQKKKQKPTPQND